MPDESCRRCGGLLLNYAMCAKCKAKIQQICRICGAKTLEQVHDQICFREDEINQWQVYRLKNLEESFSLGVLENTHPPKKP